MVPARIISPLLSLFLLYFTQIDKTAAANKPDNYVNVQG